jgi:mandelamide amidase
MTALYAAYFDSHKIDALVFPTTILPAGLIENSEEKILHNGKSVPIFLTYIHNTDPGSNAGLPGISLPIGLTKAGLTKDGLAKDGLAKDGLPVGLELDGLPGGDEKLLAIALAVEPLFAPLPAPDMKP